MRITHRRKTISVLMAIGLAVTLPNLPEGEPAAAAARPLRDRVMVGATIQEIAGTGDSAAAVEALLDAELDIVSGYMSWSDSIGGSRDRAVAASGRRAVLLAWEPWGVRFTDVTAGRKDAYLGSVADSLKAYPYTVYVRPWPEMNGRWSPWQPTADGGKPDGGTPKEFVAAWRYTVDFFRHRGVDNLKFVFNPDASDFPTNTRIDAIWPGSSYVDVLGIDGFNWGYTVRGTVPTGDRWQTFSEIFAPMYGTLTRLHPTAPVWITEMGCKEPAKEDNAKYPEESSPADPAHSKATWIRQLMAEDGFPRLEGVVFFNKRKERDWRFDSSSGALSAMRGELAARTTGTGGRRPQVRRPTSRWPNVWLPEPRKPVVRQPDPRRSAERFLHPLTCPVCRYLSARLNASVTAGGTQRAVSSGTDRKRRTGVRVVVRRISAAR
ncbi:MAG: hypothetical protein GXX79_01250 [Actinomycetales bacterium]|nr:hypothetical protein [Actinomycetales bacterium]